MKFLFKYPSRGRPDWFRNTLSNYYHRLSGNHDYYFVVTLDEDDASMNNAQMRTWLNGQKNLVYDYGDHRTKMEAINSDIPEDAWDICILISDDMVVTRDGFDKIIAGDMQRLCPDLDGLLHYWDHYRPKDDPVVTWTVMGRAFYGRYGWLYYPAYISQWCDNELSDVAQAWGKLFRCEAEIVVHQWQRHGPDALYQRDHDNFQRDKKVYESRKAKDFPLSFSQREEDTHIHRYFKDQYRGRFLDIGAGDGVTFSNTKILADMGWSGVAVEPSPNLCQALREDISLKKVTVEQAALVPKDGPTEMWHCPDFISTMNEKHKAIWNSQTTYTNLGVNGISWQTIIDRYGGNFDFVNLDIEGENIAMFKLMPGVLKDKAQMMCIEYDDGLGLIKSVLTARGFKLIHTTGENVIMGK